MKCVGDMCCKNRRFIVYGPRKRSADLLPFVLFISLLLSLTVGIPALARAESSGAENETRTPSASPSDEKTVEPEIGVFEKEKLSPKLTLESADGANSLTFSFIVQMQFQTLSKEGEESRDNQSLFRFRRIRPSIMGHLFGDDLSYKLQLSTAPGALELMDLYLDYRFHPQVSLRIGQSKVPFTRYRIQSYSRLQLVDWAIVSKYFGAERQAGFTLHNGFEKPPQLEYEVGLYTGRNARKAHGVGMALISGEKLESPSDLVDPVPLDEFHPAIAARIAYNANGIQTASETDFTKGGLRYSLGLSALWVVDPNPYRDFSLRLAPEFLLKAGGFAFSGTYYLGFYEKAGEIQNTALAMHGAVVNTSYFLRPLEFSLCFSYLASTKGLRDDTRSRAEEMIADAELEGSIPGSGLSASDVAELEKQYSKAGEMEKEFEIRFGVNVYLIGNNLKLQTDVGWLRHVRAGASDLDDWVLRAQLHLGF